MRGPAGSGCERGRRVREHGQRAGPAHGLRTCAPVQGGRGWAGWAAKPSSWLGGLLLFFLFYFSFLFHLFEFKFGLKFDFTTEVTYSLEFRKFCLIITL